MGHSKQLFIHQEIFLLALKDEQGTIISGSMYNYAIGGAVLAELFLREKITLDKKKKVALTDKHPIGDPFIDGWIEKISERKKPYSAKDLVSAIAQSKNLKHDIAQQLCKQSILKMEEDKVLFIFNRTIYPERDGRPEQEVIKRLEKAIFGTNKDIEPRTAILLALVKAANLLNYLFDKSKLKERKQRIDKIINGDLVNQATKEAIEEFNAVIVMVCVMPAITSVVT